MRIYKKIPLNIIVWILIIGVGGMVYYVWSVWMRFHMILIPDYSKNLNLHNPYDAFDSLVTAFAFILLIAGLLYQQIQISLQKKEMRDQTAEFREQKTIMQQQADEERFREELNRFQDFSVNQKIPIELIDKFIDQATLFIVMTNSLVFLEEEFKNDFDVLSKIEYSIDNNGVKELNYKFDNLKNKLSVGLIGALSNQSILTSTIGNDKQDIKKISRALSNQIVNSVMFSLKVHAISNPKEISEPLIVGIIGAFFNPYLRDFFSRLNHVLSTVEVLSKKNNGNNEIEKLCYNSVVSSLSFRHQYMLLNIFNHKYDDPINVINTIGADVYVFNLMNVSVHLGFLTERKDLFMDSDLFKSSFTEIILAFGVALARAFNEAFKEGKANRSGDKRLEIPESEE